MNLQNFFTGIKTSMVNKKIAFLGISVFVALTLLFIVTVIIYKNSPGGSGSVSSENLGTAKIDSPVNNAQFMFNNQVYYAPTIIESIVPGSYTLTVHNEGYKDESHSIVVEAGKTTNVNLTMTQLSLEDPILEEEERWTDYFDTQAEKLNQSIKTRENNYPLTKYLPQFFGSIIFDYNVNDDGSVQYVVQALPDQTYQKTDYEQTVNDFIKSKNIDPKTININWK